MTGRVVTIAPYHPSHQDDLIRMWRASFEFGVGIVDPHPLAEQAAYFERELLPHHDVRVALGGARVLGFCAASRESVVQLYVRVGCHRQGIGSRLLDWAKAQSCGRLTLYTFERNAGARAFYERHGFTVVARGFEPSWQLADVKYAWTGESSR